MIILSVLTGIKDYVEIVHKLIETDSSYFNTDSIITSYSNFGAITTYIILFIKNAVSDFVSLNWMQSIGSLPVIIPQFASAIISEISVLDGYFHNAFVFLETPLSYGNNSLIFYCLEKLTIGIINSFFLFLPTSAAHIICLRRFVMQGIEAGYLASLGTIAGNILWIGSVIFGLRFVMIPWLSLDVLRCILGLILLIKYMWDSYSDKRLVLEDLSKKKIFLLNFLLAFTEQTNIYPFLSNISISSDSTILESFPAHTIFEFYAIHSCYLLGIFLGSFSLLQFTCWFWENPAFNFYMWMVSSFKITTTFYSKILQFVFLYLTMICTVSSFSYFALDYTVTNPLGFVHQDRLMDQKGLLETAFINSKASDRNTRRNRGRHGRRERWKRRVRRYRTFDASLYDQGIYDLFTMEDLNYGFDRFWFRRKIRNHRVHFRFFPGPWMRSFKKQLSRPRLESFMGPRIEFFRILFEQVYHPEFHAFNATKSMGSKQDLQQNNNDLLKQIIAFHGSIYSESKKKILKYNQGFYEENSALRKFVRKVNNRINSSKIVLLSNYDSKNRDPVYSKRWKSLFSKMSHQSINSKLRQEKNLFQYLYKNILFKKTQYKSDLSEKENSLDKVSKKERQMLRYKTFLKNINNNPSPFFSNFSDALVSGKSNALVSERKNDGVNNKKQNSKLTDLNIETLSSIEKKPQIKSLDSFQIVNNQIIQRNSDKTMKLNSSKELEMYKPLTLFHPIKFYLKKEQAFQKKLKFYGANVYRTFGIENNAPYFRTMMRRFFYYYKPTLRWERTMRTATMRKARRKGSRIPRKENLNKKTKVISLYEDEKENFNSIIDSSKLQKPTHIYSLIGKRASNYRYQIYKDVLQHWYYSPLNRFLLKLDVDNFIRRQPNSYFLTKKEEQLLHLRRFLLSEYYQTLRWYTYMQHYSSMKKNIGGIKSFASGVYSQQFIGTFKKVRHLFALTPSFSENNILKFDQPLYNDYLNTEKNSILTTSLFHEELLGDDDLFNSKSKNFKFLADDLTSQSTKIIREYLIKAAPLREKKIQNWLQNKNYWELTQFLFKGQKTRGNVPIISERRFLIQEKENLYNSKEKFELEKSTQQKVENFMKNSTVMYLEQNKNILNASEFQQSLWVELFKKCRSILYDQESLKSYLVTHVDKRKKQQQRQEKYLKQRLERFQNWFLRSKDVSLVKKPDIKISVQHKENEIVNMNNITKENFTNKKMQFNGLTTALQKAIKEGIFVQKNLVDSSIKSNIRNNLPKINDFSNLQYSQNINTNLKEHLFNRRKIKQLQIIEIEKNVQKSLANFLNKEKEKKGSDSSLILIDSKLEIKNVKDFSLFLIYKTITPFKYLYNLGSNILVFKPLTLMKQLLPSQGLFFQKDLNINIVDSNFQQWRKQEIALTKRKKTRKTFKRLRNTNQLNFNENLKFDDIDKLLNYRIGQNKFSENTPLRQKQDIDVENFIPAVGIQNRNWNKQRIKSWKGWLNQNSSLKLHSDSQLNTNISNSIIDQFKNVIGKKFKRKRSRLRRYRRLKSRGPIKKRTLGEKLKRQFKLLKRYSRNAEKTEEKSFFSDKKVEIFQMITQRKYEPKSLFLMRETKQRRTRLIKRRFWRKHKKQKYHQNKRQQRKRRRYAMGKIRNMFKEQKRKKGNILIKQWWSNNFLPNLKANLFSYWQIKADQEIQTKLNSLSTVEILSRDEKNFNEKNLQIGDKDYKPLAIPDALRIRKDLINQGLLNFNTTSNNINSDSQLHEIKENIEKMELNNQNQKQIFVSPTQSIDIVEKVTQNIFSKKSLTKLNNFGIINEEKISSPNQSTFLININPIPFYAGWDETLRKFVITNRFLSTNKKEINDLNLSSSDPILISSYAFVNTNPSQMMNNTNLNGFLKGMNAATTLYWQIPLTTYDPDQFFVLGMDGFSPIGWRKFHFRYSKETTKPILIKTKTRASESKIVEHNSLSYNIQQKILTNFKNKQNSISSIKTDLNSVKKNNLRRNQKRYKRVKKHPRPPVWFPSGPLTNQVLPVHYIYVFYKRSRLPRDRYIRRRLRRNISIKADSLKNIQQSFTKNTDFTLRKRVKPRRQYHRKRTKINDNFVLRRRAFRDFQPKFGSTPISEERKRPIPPNFINNQTNNYSKQKRKPSSKQSTENIRIRQLRRRIQRQVIRPVWRYRPRAGGYTWPGDYLRLEFVQAPLLQTNEKSKFEEKNIKSRKIRKKKRKIKREWQIQPKKFLLKKHNLMVLKKRLEKSQNSYKRFQRSQELSYFLQK